MVKNLFCYGTLMVPEVFARISATDSSAETATLLGYRRFQMQGKSYPGSVRSPGGLIQGCLYRNIGSKALRRLDHYEGAWYKRCLVRVSCAEQKTVLAWCYVIRDFHINKLGNADWQLQAFVGNHLSLTLERLSMRNENVVITARQAMG